MSTAPSLLAPSPRARQAAGTSLSVVIPAYNEERRLGPTLARIRGRLPGAEIVVSDDGSRDETAALARAAGAVVVSAPENRGKGAALRRGMLAAAGDRILMTDADLSTPIEDLPRLELALDAGADVAAGSRRMPGARVEKRQPWARETMGRVYTMLAQLALGVRVRDFTCGFKLFTRSAAWELFSRLKIDGWGYDAELFFLASRLGLQVREVGVTWSNDEATKVRVSRDALRGLVELLVIRRGAARGPHLAQYRNPP